MNCHVCHHKLLLENNFNFKVEIGCPNGHSFVTFKGNDIIKYKLVWDTDDKASERYWIEATNQDLKQTKVIYSNYCSWGKILNIKDIKNIKKDGTILTLEYFLPLKLKDDTIQLDGIIPRLKKMIAFT